MMFARPAAVSPKLIAIIVSAVGAASAVAATGPALKVDVSADRHAINPDIYGMAYPDPALAMEIALPIVRWGGDATTRYNWKVDSTNAGDDWFFTCGGDKPSQPSAGPDKLVNDSRGWGGRVMLTIPVIDYINSATTFNCSFPVSIFGKQQKVNPYVHPTIDGKKTDAGNGRTPDGKPITLTKEQILRVHIPNTPEFQRQWVEHLVKTFGTAAQGGVAMYELDNEPGGWNNTHRDIHPDNTGHDELVSRSIAYAAAVKVADPSAIIVGPGDFMHHYQEDGKPGDGKKEHGGLGQGDYYLQQFAAYEKAHGKRLLDYFDEHYYPIGQDNETDAMRLESTRSLYDPIYKEKNWVGKYKGPANIIPNFHKWVDKSYPGTKVSISEWGFGDTHTLVGTLCVADCLGIYARERLDMACLFGPPKAKDPGANAFRIYRNYDGKGSAFGDTWVSSTSGDQIQLAIYGAQRSKDKALTLVVINKSEQELTSEIGIAGFRSADTAKVFRFSAANLKALVAQPDQPVAAAGLSAAFPARSITLIAIPAK